jgi:hypothetical protein
MLPGLVVCALVELVDRHKAVTRRAKVRRYRVALDMARLRVVRELARVNEEEY